MFNSILNIYLFFHYNTTRPGQFFSIQFFFTVKENVFLYILFKYWWLEGFWAQSTVLACTQHSSRTPGTFLDHIGLLSGKRMCPFRNAAVYFIFLFMGCSVVGDRGGCPTARLDLCVWSSFRAGLASLAALARLLLEPPPLSPDHLTSSCEDRQPSFCPVLQTSTAPPVAACYLAALFCVWNK